MTKDIMIWRFVEGGNRRHILEGAGDHMIRPTRNSLGYIRIKDNAVVAHHDFLVSFNSPIIAGNELLLDHNYRSRPFKKSCENPLQITEVGTLVRLFFRGYRKDEWVYPFLDVIRILPSVHEIKTPEHFRIKAELDDQGRLTGRAYKVWELYRSRGTKYKTFISWKRYFEALCLQK